MGKQLQMECTKNLLLLVFFRFLEVWMKKNDKHFVWRAYPALWKCACLFFYSYLKEKKKKTVISYNLISYYFHTKSKGKQQFFFCLRRFHAFFIFDSIVAVVYNDITRDTIACSLTLPHVTENRYVKYSVHNSWRYESIVSTNRIAGKRMNIKKIRLLYL